MTICLCDYVNEYLSSDRFVLEVPFPQAHAPDILAQFCNRINHEKLPALELLKIEETLFDLARIDYPPEAKKMIPDLLESFFRYLSQTGIYPPAEGWIQDLHLASGRYRSRLREDGTIKGETFRKKYTDVGRNDECPCGSGKKFKKCCMTGE